MMINFDILWPKYGIKPDGVLHCGASTGQERDVYVRHGVKEVIWVEALPEIFEKLLDHVSDVPGTVCMNACLSDENDKVVEFNISNNEAQSSSYLELAHHKIIHPEVRYIDKITLDTVRGDSLLKDFKFDGDWFLNTDLQGAELDCFRGMGDLLNKFKWVYTEVNKKETYKGCALIEEVDEYLGGFGFVRVETGQWVADTWTDALYIRQRNENKSCN